MYVDGGLVKVKYKEGIKEYRLITFARSNSKSCLNQFPCVSLGQKVQKGDLLENRLELRLCRGKDITMKMRSLFLKDW